MRKTVDTRSVQSVLKFPAMPSRSHTVRTILITTLLLGGIIASSSLLHNKKSISLEARVINTIENSSSTETPSAVTFETFENLRATSTTTTDIVTTPVAEAPKIAAEPVSWDSQITARSFLVGSPETDEIFFSRRPNEKLPLASMTKLMTAVSALSTLQATATISMSTTSASYYPVSTNWHAGERLSLHNALELLLLESDNNIAWAISEQIPDFVNIRNRETQRIGLNDTVLVDPAGLSYENIGTTYDLFVLLSFIERNHPEILTITREVPPIYFTTASGTPIILKSRNLFFNDPNFLGGKTGTLPRIGQNMIAYFKDPIRGKTVVYIVFGSQNREQDISILKSHYKETIR